jgi:hypothetical protein
MQSGSVSESSRESHSRKLCCSPSRWPQSDNLEQGRLSLVSQSGSGGSPASVSSHVLGTASRLRTPNGRWGLAQGCNPVTNRGADSTGSNCNQSDNRDCQHTRDHRKDGHGADELGKPASVAVGEPLLVLHCGCDSAHCICIKGLHTHKHNLNDISVGCITEMIFTKTLWWFRGSVRVTTKSYRNNPSVLL